MCRSLWQTPAAFTRISTWVPAGCGVGSSTSCSGALKSATLKLFMTGFPPEILLLVPHCHVLRCNATTASGGNFTASGAGARGSRRAMLPLLYADAASLARALSRATIAARLINKARPHWGRKQQGINHDDNNIAPQFLVTACPSHRNRARPWRRQ